MFCVGFVGVSTHNKRVFGLNARSTAAASV